MKFALFPLVLSVHVLKGPYANCGLPEASEATQICTRQIAQTGMVKCKQFAVAHGGVFCGILPTRT